MTATTFQATYRIDGEDLAAHVLIHRYLLVVKRAVRKLCSQGPLPKDVGREDLLQIGTIALCEAAGRFDDTRGTRFDAFAYRRVLGAMRDHLRSVSWAPRVVNQKKRSVEEAEHRLTGELGRSPTPAELAERLGWTLAELQMEQQRITNQCVLSLDLRTTYQIDASPVDLANALLDDGPSIDAELASKEFQRLLEDCMRAVLDRQEYPVFQKRFILQLSYGAIAREVGLSQTRIAQICAKSRVKMANALIQRRAALDGYDLPQTPFSQFSRGTQLCMLEATGSGA